MPAITSVQYQALDPDAAWTAVQERNPDFDGLFVYAVASTGIYCRPTCASRRPLRRNVAFFSCPPDAEKAGFRACRRCRPDADVPSATERAVERARILIEASADESLTLEQLGRRVGVSPFHLQRVFQRVVGVSPKEYAHAVRVERLKSQLKRGDTVSRATVEAGFGSGSRVYEKTNQYLGMTPAAYGRGGGGVRILYTIAPTHLGFVLIAVTERGICAVTLGDTEEQLESALRSEYHAATVERCGDELDEWAKVIVSSVNGPSTRLDLPLDVRATAFQRQVWKALQEIPAGRTRSYSAVAADIGRPGAARAVARACASNPVAVVVPCHRVVRQDGEPGEYRWGSERKRALLEGERGSAGAED